MWVRAWAQEGKLQCPALARWPPFLGLGTTCSFSCSLLAGECHLLRPSPHRIKSGGHWENLTLQTAVGFLLCFFEIKL